MLSFFAYPHPGAVVDGVAGGQLDPEMRNLKAVFALMVDKPPAHDSVLDAVLFEQGGYQSGHAVALNKSAVQRVKPGLELLREVLVGRCHLALQSGFLDFSSW